MYATTTIHIYALSYTLDMYVCYYYIHTLYHTLHTCMYAATIIYIRSIIHSTHVCMLLLLYIYALSYTPHMYVCYYYTYTSLLEANFFEILLDTN